MAVRVPKTRDRAGEGRCFRSELLPPYLKKTRRLEAVIPWLYLKGVSTNDFDEALTALFGQSVKGLSATTISRLKQGWEHQYADFRRRDWHGHEFVYLWADGIYLNIRAAERRCLLVVIGCDTHGRKHFLAIEEGFRESTESWKALLLSLRDRGLKVAPTLAIGDGAMGFWTAMAEVFPTTRSQRCWVHKTVNVLDKLPKTLHSQAKSALHAIWQAEIKDQAQLHTMTALTPAPYRTFSAPAFSLLMELRTKTMITPMNPPNNTENNTNNVRCGLECSFGT